MRVNETSSETNVATETVTANGAMNLPAMEFIEAMGRNTQTFVRAEAATARATSEADFSTVLPTSWLRFIRLNASATFSRMTMEFVTRMPVEMPRADIVATSIV